MNREDCERCKHYPAVCADDNERYFVINCLPKEKTENIIKNACSFIRNHPNEHLMFLYQTGLDLPNYIFHYGVAVNHNCPYYMEHQLTEWNKNK